MRLLRNSSLEPDFQRHSDLFRSKLAARGYSDEECVLACEGINFLADRTALLGGRTGRDADSIVCVLPYHPQVERGSWMRALSDHWYWIDQDPTLRMIFPVPPMLGLRTHPNLGSFLVSSKFH
jgi:hypothetical protein